MIITQHLRGLEADALEVSTRPSSDFQVLGLKHDAAAREVRVRVACAFTQLDYDPPRTTVTISPPGAAGASLDLAVAVAAAGMDAGDTVLIGELALTGAIRPVRGIYAHVAGARAAGRSAIIVPEGNASEAGLVGGITVFAARSLEDVFAHLGGVSLLSPVRHTTIRPGSACQSTPHPDANRLAEALAAGKRRILLVGPLGASATMLARRVVDQLDPMTDDEIRSATAIHSVAGLVDDSSGGFLACRPFRAPHHTVSEAGLIGGGDHARPGEVSLAHHGVLFLDEIQEFRKATVAALWQTLDRGSSVLSRGGCRAASFPAVPAAVIASTHPCPCGRGGTLRCKCSDAQRARWSSALVEVSQHFDTTITIEAVPTAARIASM